MENESKPDELTTGEQETPVGPGEAVEGAEAPAPEAASPPWLPTPPQVHRYKDADAIAAAAAKRFLDSAQRAVNTTGRFIVVLAGGSTPRRLYSLLTQPPYHESVPWSKTLFVFGDERCVPPDDEASNYRMARETLFEPLEIPEHHVFRMKGEQPPAEAARRYEVRLSDVFLGEPRRHFDLVLLGIGPDGHTASLFPGTVALDERARWAVANHVPHLDAWRLTLTFPALNSARRVIFLATGDAKAQVIGEAFGGIAHAQPHPCERVAPFHARREVLLDHAAASLVPHKQRNDKDAPHASGETAAEDSAGSTDVL
jgi:6-phosphogluconolactonase